MCRYGQLEDLKWTAGSLEELTEYLWHKKLFAHYFCPTCGVEVLENELEINKVGVNARTLDGVDPAKLKREFIDGKNFNL